VLPLSDYLLELLEQRSLYAAGEQVFATSRGLLSNLRYAQNTVIEASGVAFCPNDLRRTFITAAESLDIPAYALKRLINHKTNDVTGGYIVMDTERLRKPMQRITDYLLGLGGLREGAAVVPFESAGL
jgi:hypothetical protein